MKRKRKTPLQEWAWNRFQLKGAVTGIIVRTQQLQALPDVTEHEKECLNACQYELNKLMEHWPTAHQLTRKRRQIE